MTGQRRLVYANPVGAITDGDRLGRRDARRLRDAGVARRVRCYEGAGVAMTEHPPGSSFVKLPTCTVQILAPH